MTQLERADLHAAIETRYPDNTTEDITPLRLREGLHELVDSVFVTATDTGAVPNVPLYQAGTTYVVGFTVRYTPLNGKEGFYAAINPGKLTAPGPSNTTDWKVVPGPVEPTALSQTLTLFEAQGLDRNGVVAGREYLIQLGTNAQGKMMTITVRGTANDYFDVEGTLEIDGVLTAITNFDVQAVTWKLSVTDKQLYALGTSLPLRPARIADDTLTVDDLGALVPFTGSAPVTLTVPAGLGLATPFGIARVCYPMQLGSGTLTIAPGVGVNLIVPPGAGLRTSGAPARLVLVWVDSNTVLVEGGIV